MSSISAASKNQQASQGMTLLSWSLFGLVSPKILHNDKIISLVLSTFHPWEYLELSI